MSKHSGPVVKMTAVVKAFPGVVANDRVDFELLAGEVHALLGENGAGKTTLMNVLYGLYSSDGGEIQVRGKTARISSPRDSIKLGIAMVHQHFELVDTLTVAENVALGLRSDREPLLEMKSVEEKVEALSHKYGLEVSPSALVQQLTVGERQRVEILKALYRGADILILDEPTSVLTPQETDGMFSFLRSMAAEGDSVIIITHKLPEVLAVSDRVTVLRKGKVVGTRQTSSTSANELAFMMMGRQPVPSTASSEAPVSGNVLEVRNLFAKNSRGALGLKGLTLNLAGGEVLGLAGVAGNGQKELVEVLSGLRRTEKGAVLVKGQDVTNSPPSEMIEKGIGVIPEDRRGSGVIPEFSIAENLMLERRWQDGFSRHGILNEGAIREQAQRLVAEFSISTPDVGYPAYTLSGGNLQKLMLARVLSRRPGILVAAQPTAGLDVGATEFIWERIRSERGRGVGVLLVSSDIGEILELSDRVACIYDGHIAGVFPAAEADSRKIGLLIGGAESS